MSDTNTPPAPAPPQNGVQLKLGFSFPNPHAMALQVGINGIDAYTIVLPRQLARDYLEGALAALKEQDSGITIVPEIPGDALARAVDIARKSRGQ